MFKLIRVLAIAVPAAVTITSYAQSSSAECSPGFVNLLPIHQIGDGPYSFTAKATYEHRLLDGSYIRGFAMVHDARDGQGRTRSETPMSCIRDKDGQPRLAYSVNLFDPSTGTTMIWSVWPMTPTSDKSVIVLHRTPVKSVRSHITHRAAATQSNYVSPDGVQHEDLGMRTISGVEAHGLRDTRTVAAGQEGNEVPLKVVAETWFSEKYGFNLAGSSDDPRLGKSSYEITSFVADEPNASLFTPPADYRIEDHNPAVASAIDKPQAP